MAVEDVIFEAQIKFDRSKSDLESLEKELKDVTKTIGTAEKGSEEYRKAQIRLKEINKQLTGSFDKQGKSVTSFSSKLKTSGIALAGYGAAAFGISAGFREAFNTVKDFDQAVANLSSITGAKGADLEFYKEQAKAIGEETTLSATQAVKAFEIIGSKSPALLKNKEALAAVTKEAVILAESYGGELPEAASALTASLNQFNIPAEESRRVINVLAAGSKEGSAGVASITESLKNSGAVLAASNVEFETSVALIEQLATKQLEGAEAGTALRGVTLKLRDAGKGYASGQFDIIDALKQVKEESEQLTSPLERNQQLQKLFGQESITAAQILLDGIGNIETFRDAVTGTNTAIEQQATRTKTLEGATERLASAYEGFILNAEKGTGILAKGIDFLATNFRTIAKFIGLTTLAFITYRFVVKSSTIAVRTHALLTKALSVAKAFLRGGIKAARIEMQLFNTATKANVIGLVVSLLATAVTAFLAFRDGAKEAAAAQRELNEAQKEALAFKDRASNLIAEANVAKDLDKEQVKSLKNRIDQEILALKDKQTRVIAIEQQTAKDAVKIDAARIEEIEKLRKKLEASPNNKKLQNLIRNLESQKSIQAQILDEQTGFQKKEIETLIKSLQEARDGLKATTGGDATSGNVTDSLEFLQKKVADFKKELASISTSNSTAIEAKIKEIEVAEQKLKEATEKVFGTDDTKAQIDEINRLEDISIKKKEIEKALQSEILKIKIDNQKERIRIFKEAGKEETDEYKKLTHQLELLKIEREGKLNKESKDKTKADFDSDAKELDEKQRHEEALLSIEGGSEQERLKMTLEFEEQRLGIIKAMHGAKSLEYRKQQNLIEEIEAQITDTKKTEADKRVEIQKEAALNLAKTIVSAANEILSVELDKNQQQIEGQQTRIEKAKELAEKGNADILEQEEKRLDKLQEKRAKFARAQAALAQIEIVANSLIAISKAAAQGGAAAPFTIAATLIALGAGIIQARQQAQNAASFDVGGEYDYATGRATYSNQTGFTGEGSFSQVSTSLGNKPYTYHKREFISNGKAVSVGRNRWWLEKLNKEAFNMDHVFETARKVHRYEIEHKVKGGKDSAKTEQYFIAMKEEMSQLRKEIRDKPVSNISVTEDGFKEIMHQNNIKTTRMKRIGG